MAADYLIDMVGAVGLSLALPPGTTTWQARNLRSIIDLFFVSDLLANRVLACGVSEDHRHSSDHLPILSTLDLSFEQEPTHPRWA